MTKRDQWQQRPAVLRYRDFCDRVRAAAPPELRKQDCFALHIVAHLSVKASWSKKKKAKLAGSPCRSKPDADNILKSVGDALFVEDSHLWDVRCQKFWCVEQEERTAVVVRFNA